MVSCDLAGGVAPATPGASPRSCVSGSAEVHLPRGAPPDLPVRRGGVRWRLPAAESLPRSACAVTGRKLVARMVAVVLAALFLGVPWLLGVSGLADALSHPLTAH